MRACIFLVTLANAKIVDDVDAMGTIGAAQLFKKYFKEHEWSLNRALVTLGPKVPREATQILRNEGRTGKSMLRSSTALLQADLALDKKKKTTADWTEEELNRARDILNGMYDTEQAELDVLLVDCKKFLGTLKEQMDENARVRTVLAENTATARATQLEATKTKKEAEGQLTSLKDEYAAHSAACDKTLSALKANYDLAAFDYNVGLKIQNMSTCDDTAKQAAIDAEEAAAAEEFIQLGNATHQESQAKAKADPMLVVKHSEVKKANSIMECHNSRSPTDDDDSGVFFMFPHQQHEMHSEAGRFAMARMAKLAMQRKMGRHAYNWHVPHRQHYAISLVEEDSDDDDEQDPETTTALPGKGEMPSESELTTTPIPGESPSDLMPPAPKCNVNAVPNCPLLNDAISTMVGELRDTFVKEKTAYELQLTECNKISAEYEAQIM